MKKRFSTKLISLLLAVIMVVSIVPVGMVSANAASNEVTVYNFCIKELKVNVATACGILANIQKESSFNPTCSFLDTNGKTSYGICQWNGGRFTNLKNYCSKYGLNYKDINAQLQFLKHELTGSEKSNFNKVKKYSNTATGAYNAGVAWAHYVERCAHYYKGKDQFAQRGQLAQMKAMQIKPVK